MNFLRNLLAYLEGDNVEKSFVDYLARRATKVSTKLYRCVLMEAGKYKIGDDVNLSQNTICSCSSSPEMALGAAKSFANDSDKEVQGMEFYVLEVQNPLVCLSYKAIKRYLQYFDNYGYTMKIVIPRLDREQESIILGKGFGKVVMNTVDN